MIVKCEQCQTRFKIPDEKVTEKGVKVRCTKCQHTFRVKRDGTSSATVTVPAFAPPAAADPFAKFGAGSEDAVGEATRPGMYALGVEASRHSGPLQPSYAAQRDVPSQVFIETTRVGAIPSAPPSRPGHSEVTQRSSPFDFAAALDQGQGGAPAFDFAQPPPPEPAAAAEYQPARTYQAPVTEPGHDPFAAMELGEATHPAAPAMTQPEVPSVFGPGGGDFVLATEPPPPQSIRPDALGLSEHGEVAADTSQRSALFDMPAPEPDRRPEAFTAPDLERVPEPPISRPRPSAPSVGGMGAPERLEGPGPTRRLGALIFNVLIASVLVAVLTVTVTVYLNEGKVELASFSTERLKAAFSSPAEWAALDLSNGLYDTRAGRPVFFIRGEVKNGSGRATRARVRAEILDGNTSIRHADAWLGAVPTPEDLYAISVAEDVERLMGKLAQSAAEVRPGEKRGFLVPFYEYPSELKGFRVRVTVIESKQGETAAR